ncbi:PREDICTED: 39S ribosomal protein L37, mitochondrial-like [Priapulus caudatus]|uniref:Large ribosomal subunit protein mL37 n=1 Tax=Priapulus caudatus TaxID=37621 RepID=A0ABM1EQ92_PRICU|nr:PREDICTED: 39S ribosomal protein L37, mitochondrial-like [Priapulus caudatus]XP_014674363.1 PREDICTED: 39S ribosomal protein L37, mitochondrial-like [Priapulus caudatus]
MENMGDLILINGTVHINITSKKCLPAFATDAEVTASENHHLADIFPLKQTIDLSKENIYTAEEQIGLAGRTDSHPHTLLTRNPHYTYIDSQLNSKAMMHCMAHCIIEAHRMYGADVKQLPQPITVQHIGVNHTGQVFYFTAFQLNTLDFSSHDGVKNFTWFDGGNELFSDITKDGNVVGYNPEVFKKVLAFYLNGL